MVSRSEPQISLSTLGNYKLISKVKQKYNIYIVVMMTTIALYFGHIKLLFMPCKVGPLYAWTRNHDNLAVLRKMILK